MLEIIRFWGKSMKRSARWLNFLGEGNKGVRNECFSLSYKLKNSSITRFSNIKISILTKTSFQLVLEDMAHVKMYCISLEAQS